LQILIDTPSGGKKERVRRQREVNVGNRELSLDKRNRPPKKMLKEENRKEKEDTLSQRRGDVVRSPESERRGPPTRRVWEKNWLEKKKNKDKNKRKNQKTYQRGGDDTTPTTKCLKGAKF